MMKEHMKGLTFGERSLRVEVPSLEAGRERVVEKEELARLQCKTMANRHRQVLSRLDVHSTSSPLNMSRD